MKKRKGRWLIFETAPTSDLKKDGPIIAGEFSSSFWAFMFKHFENRVPLPIAESTKWKGFRSWHDAEQWLEAQQ